jgi:hypothetical protein
MKVGFGIALALAGCLAATPRLTAQAPGDSGAGQGQAGGSAQKPAAKPPQAVPQSNPQGGANPFPEDTSKVPVLPSTTTDVPAGTFGESDDTAASLPGDDLDPVRSPDDSGSGSSSVQELESSSDVKAMDSLLPGPGDDETGGKRKKKDDVIEGEPRETPKEDITVGRYYLDNKNWKAALSRFQSALVLAPDEPEVYWGLAESERHLGNLTEAKANYQKVIEYDPDSRHGKDAKKALKEPELENAKAGPEGAK